VHFWQVNEPLLTPIPQTGHISLRPRVTNQTTAHDHVTQSPKQDDQEDPETGTVGGPSLARNPRETGTDAGRLTTCR
jgi:hypothetical protein